MWFVFILQHGVTSGKTPIVCKYCCRNFLRFLRRSLENDQLTTQINRLNGRRTIVYVKVRLYVCCRLRMRLKILHIIQFWMIFGPTVRGYACF